MCDRSNATTEKSQVLLREYSCRECESEVEHCKQFKFHAGWLHQLYCPSSVGDLGGAGLSRCSGNSGHTGKQQVGLKHSESCIAANVGLSHMHALPISCIT